jgi:hypothetical protein
MGCICLILFIMVSGAGHSPPALHFLMASPAYLAEGDEGVCRRSSVTHLSSRNKGRRVHTNMKWQSWPHSLPSSSLSESRCFASFEHYAYCVIKQTAAFRLQSLLACFPFACPSRSLLFSPKQIDRQAQRLWLVAAHLFSHRSALVSNTATKQMQRAPGPCSDQVAQVMHAKSSD